MERHTRALAGCGLVLSLVATGCRSTRSEVPPGRPYLSDGRQVPPVGFSSDPHPIPANALSMGGMPDRGSGLASGAGGSTGQFGTPAPGSNAPNSNWGAPTGNTYGPPGTAGAGTPPGTGLPPSSTSPLSPSPAGGAPAVLPGASPNTGMMGESGPTPSPL